MPNSLTQGSKRFRALHFQQLHFDAARRGFYTAGNELNVVPALNNAIAGMKIKAFSFFIVWVIVVPWFAESALYHAKAQEKFTDSQLEFFETKVRPLLVEHCYDCHGAESDPPEGGLSLASRKSILVGGDSGSALNLDNLEKSHILTAVQYGEIFQMPPDSRLSDEEVAIIEKWVLEQAPWPADSDTDAVARNEFNLAERRAQHWCWQPIIAPEIPNVDQHDWPLDPIDHFILAKLETAKIAPAGPTDKRTWLRRVTFDLTGLPPTKVEIDNFLNDTSEKAFETVVDRLLASPHFGERWARHWMDLIRYAETCGHEFDYPIPNAFQYRDYLIRAFNEDVPYNDFVVEHIAGDLIETPRRHPNTDINESILGTGFWFLGEATHGPVDVKGDEAGRIDNQIDVFGKTFQGLTIACARCHDHKFDAISAADYYGLSGFLQSSRRQNVMLDPNNKIREGYSEALESKELAESKIASYLNTLEEGNAVFEKTEKYMQAAIQYLQQEPSWQLPKRQLVEGESLKTSDKKTAGNVVKQDLKEWNGGSQLWWSGGQAGDTIELEINVPVAGKYSLFGCFTNAPDYGIVKISVDGQTLLESLDLYSKTLKRSEELALGSLDLKQGVQKLQIELIGKNKNAVPGMMFGLDYLLLTAASDPTELANAKKLKDAWQEKYGLDDEMLQQWIDAIKDPATQDLNHPFFLLRKSAESSIDLNTESADAFYRNLYRQLTERNQSSQDWFETKSNNLTDLVGSPPSSWNRQGFAFDATSAGSRFDPVSSSMIRSASEAPHSGLCGERFQGVLRSPTFTIESPFIYYHANARNAQIRLIIDGFRLDINNGLLFHQMNLRVDTSGQWKWVRQAGDLKNYLGHRAFIEIIDQGDGFIGIDEVRTTNFPKPGKQPHWTAVSPEFHAISDEAWLRERNEGKTTPLEVVTNSLANAIRKLADYASEDSTVEDELLFNFLAQYNLPPHVNFGALAEELEKQKTVLAEINQRTPSPTLAIGMVDGSPEDEYVFIRGNHKNQGPFVPRSPITALKDETSWPDRLVTSGRMELAKNLIDNSNPLTRRVIVNRLWHHLTGRGLVASVDNFGVLGSKPSHPELLDYLATEFSNQGWSIKAMIRRIVLSQTYRMDSESEIVTPDADPENQLLYKARVRRLQGEAIRDSLLAVSGELDDAMYGPGVPIHLTAFMQGRGRPGRNGPVDGDRRRSIYIEVRRNFLSPMMLAFDTPIPFNSIGKRNQSNVPAQALILMNDPLVIEQAEKWATRILDAPGDQSEKLNSAFECAMGRLPDAQEQENLINFINTQAESYGANPDDLRVWKDLCHVLFNLKEFIYLK